MCVPPQLKIIVDNTTVNIETSREQTHVEWGWRPLTGVYGLVPLGQSLPQITDESKHEKL